jgi:aminoglycoside phosphotransferase (APT) family kinase protein
VSDELPEHLRSWVEAESGTAVVSSHPIGRGASRRIWAVELASGDRAVVRYDTGDGPVAGTPLTLAREGAVYRALAGTGVPVPSLRAVHPDGTALLVDHADGEEQLDSVADAERRSIAEDYGRVLAHLHALDPADLELGPLGVEPGTDATAADLALWQAIDATRSADGSSPVVRIALVRLAGSVPESARASVCHGDAGPGNFLHRDGRVAAALDWEFAHLGDPHDDLAWVTVRNQLLGRPLDVAACFASWRAGSGTSIELARLEWFRVLVLTRMLISCDASIAWAGRDSASAQVQSILQPYLGAAIFEALRRSGLSDPGDAAAEDDARATWSKSTIATLLDDPTALDDLGALL